MQTDPSLTVAPDAKMHLQQLMTEHSLEFPVNLEVPFQDRFDAAALVPTRKATLVALGVIAVFTFLDLWSLPSSHRAALR